VTLVAAALFLERPDHDASLIGTVPSPSDLDAYRSAHRWVQRHCDDATPKAREMVEAMRKKGDADGADVWLRIVVAIGDLGTLPS